MEIAAALGVLIASYFVWLFALKRKVNSALHSGDPYLLLDTLGKRISLTDQFKVIQAIASIQDSSAVSVLETIAQHASHPENMTQAHLHLLMLGNKAAFDQDVKLIADYCGYYLSKETGSWIRGASFGLHNPPTYRSLQIIADSDNFCRQLDLRLLDAALVRFDWKLKPVVLKILGRHFSGLSEDRVQNLLNSAIARCAGSRIGVERGCRYEAAKKSGHWKQVLTDQDSLKRLVLTVKASGHRRLLSCISSLPDQTFELYSISLDEDGDGNRFTKDVDEGIIRLDLSKVRLIATSQNPADALLELALAR